MTSLPKIAFWFIRHGQTDCNLAGLAQGALDVDLNETGRTQARQAGPLLQGKGITSIISSPMHRAKQTAEILNGFLQLSISYVSELREASFGEKEAQTAQPWLAEWIGERYTPAGGESFAALMMRLQSVLCEVLPLKKGPVLIVAHGGVLRAIRALMDLPKEGPTGNAIPLYCEPTEKGWHMLEAQPLGTAEK